MPQPQPIKSSRAQFPPLAFISFLVYIGALIASSIELRYSNDYLQATCSIRCVEMFVVTWGIAIPASALSIVFILCLFILHHQGRLVSRAAVLFIGFALVALWLCVVVTGWLKPISGSGASLRVRLDYGVSLYFRRGVTSTGVFWFCTDFYNVIINRRWSNDNTIDVSSWTLARGYSDQARMAMAATVLCTMAL